MTELTALSLMFTCVTVGTAFASLAGLRAQALDAWRDRCTTRAYRKALAERFPGVLS